MNLVASVATGAVMAFLGGFEKSVYVSYTCVMVLENHLKLSCADLIRASTSLLRRTEGVGGRDTPGHDEIRETISFQSTPPDFPRTALRESGNPGLKCS